MERGDYAAKEEEEGEGEGDAQVVGSGAICNKMEDKDDKDDKDDKVDKDDKDDFVLSDARRELEELRNFLKSDGMGDAGDGGGSLSDGGQWNQIEVERIIESAEKDPTPSEVGKYIDQSYKGRKRNYQRKGRRAVQGGKKVGRQYDCLVGKEKRKGKSKVDSQGVGNDEGTRGNDGFCGKEHEVGGQESEFGVEQTIVSEDFRGLFSEKSVSHYSKGGKGSVCGKSIHESDFGGFSLDWDDASGDCDGCEDDLRPATIGGFHGSEDAEEQGAELEDILNGILPASCEPEKIVEVLEQVVECNKRLQEELEATLGSIDESILNNCKAHQLVEALQTMRVVGRKFARPKSSSVMDDEKPVCVNGRVLASYWSTPDGKHPSPNNDTKRLETIMEYLPVLGKMSSVWLVSESKQLCEGLLSHVQEVALHVTVDVMEKRRGQGQRLMMATCRSVITEVGALKLDSPICLEIISRFENPEWDKISRMFVPSRTGYECMLQWNYFVRPDRVTTSFGQQEMKKIGLLSTELLGRNWPKIASELGTGRSPTECFQAHIQSLARPSRVWNAESDKKLLEAVEKHGAGHWVAISLDVGRTAKACECRYTDVLLSRQSNPEAEGKRDAWDLEEDLVLLKAIRKHGKRWRDVARDMQTNRKPAALRDRYTKYLDPTYDRSAFSMEEKQKILDLGREQFKRLGRIRWSEVARELPVKRLPFLVHQIYQHMMKCLEKGKDPFSSNPVMRSLEEAQKRLHINIDGTKAINSDHGMTIADLDPPMKRARVDLTTNSPGEAVHTKHQIGSLGQGEQNRRYVNQCVIQAPSLPQGSIYGSGMERAFDPAYHPG